MTELDAAGGPWGTRLCTIAIYLAAMGLLLVIVTGPGQRAGLYGMATGLLAYTAASLAMIIATVAAIVGLVMTKGAGGGASQVLTWIALVPATVVTANNLVWMQRAMSVPPIHDITTDIESPPEFVAILPLRADAPNPPGYDAAQSADAQISAYPDIATIVVARPADSVFNVAQSVATNLGWEIVDSQAEEGRIEATDTTRYFGFKDDVVIRISSDGPGSRVDLRSKSRVGLGDIGANANRIRRFRDLMIAETAPR